MINVHITNLKSDMPEPTEVAIIELDKKQMVIPVSDAKMLKKILNDIL